MPPATAAESLLNDRKKSWVPRLNLQNNLHTSDSKKRNISLRTPKIGPDVTSTRNSLGGFVSLNWESSTGSTPIDIMSKFESAMKYRYKIFKMDDIRKYS